MSLILDVSGLPREVGRELTFEVSGSGPELSSVGWAESGPYRVTGRAMWTGETVMVEGRAVAGARLTCSRCLRPFEVVLEAGFSREYRERWRGGVQDGAQPAVHDWRNRRSHPGGQTGRRRGRPEVPPGKDSVLESRPNPSEDPLTYSNNELDLSFPAWEALALEVPMKPVCREDCRGLCPVCGADLNEKTCGCEAQRADPRLLSLKELLENKERGD